MYGRSQAIQGNAPGPGHENAGLLNNLAKLAEMQVRNGIFWRFCSVEVFQLVFGVVGGLFHP